MAKVLLVEDNEMNRDMLSRRLIRRGYEIVMAVDGEEGITAAKAENPALKILFMTGLVHRSPAVLRSGLGPVLHKPFTSEELLKAIESV